MTYSSIKIIDEDPPPALANYRARKCDRIARNKYLTLLETRIVSQLVRDANLWGYGSFLEHHSAFDNRYNAC
jgi:hypothetical protein